DFRAQAVQVFENIKTALASIGGSFEHIVKLTSYLTNIDANAPAYREVRASYFPNKAVLPASTLLQVPRLANAAYLLEVEVVAILPPRACGGEPCVQLHLGSCLSAHARPGREGPMVREPVERPGRS